MGLRLLSACLPKGRQVIKRAVLKESPHGPLPLERSPRRDTSPLRVKGQWADGVQENSSSLFAQRLCSPERVQKTPLT